MFIDVDNVPLGGDVQEAIETAIRQSCTLLVLIGPNWDAHRLQNDDDWVRVELEIARRSEIGILPVLVRGGELPLPKDLPPNVRWLPRINGATVSHSRWAGDIEAVINVLELNRAEAERKAKAEAERKAERSPGHTSSRQVRHPEESGVSHDSQPLTAPPSPSVLPVRWTHRLQVIAAIVSILATAIVAYQAWFVPDSSEADDPIEDLQQEANGDTAAPSVAAPTVAKVKDAVSAAGYEVEDFSVSISNGTVAIFGTVADDETRSEVLAAVESQPGVASVLDRLSIAEAGSSSGEVVVTAAQAGVLLTGVVPDQSIANTIAERATSVYSLDQVDNQLAIDTAVTTPVQITIAGAMSDEVLFGQISSAFDDLEEVDVAARLITLEESNEVETALNSLDSIQFASGSALIDPGSAAILDEAAEILFESPDLQIEIGGHTDSTGSAEANEALSQARADAVRAALIERGVSNTMLSIGFGERRLRISPDDTPEAQQENRRIEFRLLN